MEALIGLPLGAQLLHRASQKFVSVMPRVMAEGEKDCFQVYLSPEGGEGCALLPGESAP